MSINLGSFVQNIVNSLSAHFVRGFHIAKVSSGLVRVLLSSVISDGTIASIATSTQTVSGTKKAHPYTNDYIYIICSGAPLTGSEIQIAQIAD